MSGIEPAVRRSSAFTWIRRQDQGTSSVLRVNTSFAFEIKRQDGFNKCRIQEQHVEYNFDTPDIDA